MGVGRAFIGNNLQGIRMFSCQHPRIECNCFRIKNGFIRRIADQYLLPLNVMIVIADPAFVWCLDLFFIFAWCILIRMPFSMDVKNLRSRNRQKQQNKQNGAILH